MQYLTVCVQWSQMNSDNTFMIITVQVNTHAIANPFISLKSQSLLYRTGRQPLPLFTPYSGGQVVANVTIQGSDGHYRPQSIQGLSQITVFDDMHNGVFLRSWIKGSWLSSEVFSHALKFNQCKAWSYLQAHLADVWRQTDHTTHTVKLLV